MNEQLTQNNILHSLLNVGQLEAGKLVVEPSLQQKMQLVGFVPCYMDLQVDAMVSKMIEEWLNMNDGLVVSSFRLRCKNGKRTYPIMSKIEVAKEGIFETDESCLALDENRAAKFAGKNFTTFLYLTDSFQKEDKTENVYKSNNPLFIFTRNIGEYKVVSEMFLCLCRYINTVTGLQNYMLLPPDQLVIIKEKQEND